jgi:PAS domain S-box-containing protein
MDVHGAITSANRLTRLSHSADTGELIGKLVWELMPTDEQERSHAAFMLAIAAGQNPPVVRRSIYDRTGNFRFYDIYRNVILDAEGRAAGMRAVSVDVTEAHKAHQESEHARQWLESVMASLTAAVIVTDPLGIILSVNPAAEKLFGWKAGELIGMEVENAFSVNTCISSDQSVIDFSMAMEKCVSGTATILDKAGREMLVEIGASPIVDKNTGFTTGVVSVLRQVEAAS